MRLLQQYREALFPDTPFEDETPAKHKPLLSVCVSVKNRSRVRHGDKDLLLFPHCVKALAAAANELAPLGRIELVISDYLSDDWPLEDWLDSCRGPLDIVHLQVQGDFSRGAGLHVAAEQASADTLLFLDADMLVSEEFLRACLRNDFAQFALFPVMRRLDENGSEEEWDSWSHGISCMSRDTFHASGGIPPFKSWGGEDDIFHARVASLIAIKRERLPGLLHQWHPEKCRHEHYVHTRKSDYASFVSDPNHQTTGKVISIYWAEHPHWKGYLHLLEGGRMCRPGGDAGSYELIEGQSLVLRWDKWKMVKLLWRAEEGIFASEDGSFTLLEQERPIAATYENFWPNFSARNASEYFPFSILSRLPIRISSVFGKSDRLYDLIFSGESLHGMKHDGATFVVARDRNAQPLRSHGFVGIPYIEHPYAFHLPLFYYYWDRYEKSGFLADQREAGIDREFGITVLIQNHTTGTLARRRWEIAHALSHHFPVHGSESMRQFAPAGSKMNYHKIGKTLEDKLAFLARYTHHLCMENSSARGYLTEKLFDALYAGAIPIYQGDPHVAEWVEPSALVACDNLTVEMIVAKIRESESLTDVVQLERERLCKVTLEEMIVRLENFVQEINEA
jgi:glycosyltransferase involved in cell wall biosynthesis